MKQEPVIEKNMLCKKELMMLQIIFHQNFLAFQDEVQNHPLITEHRETANIINEYLNQLFLALHASKLFFSILQTSHFQLPHFLRIK